MCFYFENNDNQVSCNHILTYTQVRKTNGTRVISARREMYHPWLEMKTWLPVSVGCEYEQC